MSRVRVHNFSISLDGFGTGDGLSLEAPFGHAGHRLHEWMFATRFWDAAGTAGVDNAFAERHEHGIGAEIMGAGKFGPPGWQDDPEWRGWWGSRAASRWCRGTRAHWHAAQARILFVCIRRPARTGTQHQHAIAASAMPAAES
jgi:hypothetical protein